MTFYDEIHPHALDMFPRYTTCYHWAFCQMGVGGIAIYPTNTYERSFGRFDAHWRGFKNSRKTMRPSAIAYDYVKIGAFQNLACDSSLIMFLPRNWRRTCTLCADKIAIASTLNTLSRLQGPLHEALVGFALKNLRWKTHYKCHICLKVEHLCLLTTKTTIECKTWRPKMTQHGPAWLSTLALSLRHFCSFCRSDDVLHACE